MPVTKAEDYLCEDTMENCDGSKEWFVEHVLKEVTDARRNGICLDPDDVIGWMQNEWESALDILIDDIPFYTPPENKGQIVEVSYAKDIENELVVQRTVDHSSNQISYAVADLNENMEYEGNTTPVGFTFEPFKM